MIYLDNAATTETYKEAAETALNYMTEKYFNPSALYSDAVEIFKQVRFARENIKKALHAPDGELFFLSGGTEGDNMALFCSKKTRGSRIIVSEGEHDAVINAANRLKEQGFDVRFASINQDGSVNEESFTNLLDNSVSLVSIMHVSNETGAVNDIKRLVKLTRKYAPNALFHSDGVQAFCKIKVNLSALDVDLYTISGHKIHAPKGIGALFVKNGVSLKPLIFGGGQEYGMRSGTENTAGILAFYSAVNKNLIDFDKNYTKKQQYLERLKKDLSTEIGDVKFISPTKYQILNAKTDGVLNLKKADCMSGVYSSETYNRLYEADLDLNVYNEIAECNTSSFCAPHILTVAFKGIRGEVLLHSLEKYGIAVGIGSACSSHHESRFKKLLGLSDAYKDGIVRFSVSEFNDIDEIGTVIDAIKSEYKLLSAFKRQ